MHRAEEGQKTHPQAGPDLRSKQGMEHKQRRHSRWGKEEAKTHAGQGAGLAQ